MYAWKEKVERQIFISNDSNDDNSLGNDDDNNNNDIFVCRWQFDDAETCYVLLSSYTYINGK